MTPVSYALLAAVILLIVGFRMRRLMQSRPLKTRSLWILPTVVFIVFVLSLQAHPPRGEGWLWMIGGLVLGAALGWLRAKTIRLTRDAVTGEIMAQGSAMAIVFLFILLAARLVMRGYFAAQAAAHPATAAAADAAFLALALGLLAARAIEMTLRARALNGGPPPSMA